MKAINYIVAAAAILFAACLAFCLTGAVSVEADDPAEGDVGYQFVDNGVTYTITEAATTDPVANGTVKLYRVDLGITELTVPATVTLSEKTYDVTELDSYSFYSSYSNVTTLSLPEGLTTIGHQAFSQCKIKSLIIPSTVTTIADTAFFNTSFESISVTAGNTNFVFENNTLFGLDGSSSKVCIYIVLNKFNEPANYVIPDTVTKICSRAFSNVDNLGNITIPATVSAVGNGAFGGSGVGDVTWSTTADVPSDCFGNSKITSITFNQSGAIKSIQYYAFKNSSLESLTFASGSYAVNIGGEILYNTNVKTVCLPEGVTTLGDSAFSYTKELTSLTIPSTVTSIGRFVLQNCDKLVTIDVNEGNTSYLDVENRVLYNTGKTQLIAYAASNTATSFVLPNTVTTICEYAFSNAKNITSFTFESESHLESIQQQGMQHMTGLTAIQLPSSLKSLGMSAFNGCTGFTEIDLSNVTSLTQNAFEDCTGLRSVTLANGLTIIPYLCFSGCTSLTKISIPSSVKTIGMNSFSGCTSLTTVTFGDGIEMDEIKSNAFSGCTSLISVDIPSVEYIRSRAFSNCSSMLEVVLPSTLKGMEGYVFTGCDSLLYVINNSSSITKENLETAEAVNSKHSPVISTGTSKLVIKTVGQNTYVFSKIGSVDYYTLLTYAGSTGVITLPDDIGGINGYAVTGGAFKNLSGITAYSVTDSNTMFSVDSNGVLYNKDKTVLIAYPSARTKDVIDVYYSGNKEYSYFTVPASVTALGDYAFYGSNLDIIYITNDTFTTAGFGLYSIATKSKYWDAVFVEAPALERDVTIASNVFLKPNINGYCYVNEIKYIFELTIYKITDSDPEIYRENIQTYYYLGDAVSLAKDANCSNMAIDHWSADLPTTATFSGKKHYDVYERTTYPVIFYTYGCSGSMSSVEFTYGIESTLPECGFTKNYYDFIGWATTSDGSAVYKDGETRIFNLTNNPGDRIYLYAVWDYHKYNVDFVTNGGSAVDSIQYTYVTDTFDLPVSVKAGYTLSWYAKEDLSGNTYTSISKYSSSDYTFYAKWTYISVDFEYGDYICSTTSSPAGDAPGTVTLKTYNGVSGKITIPTDVVYNEQHYTVTGLGDDLFNSKSISVTIPATIVSIGKKTFYSANIGELSFENGSALTTIGASAFYNIRGITELVLPEGLSSIGSFAFYNASLTSLTIPSTVTEMDGSAFSTHNKESPLILTISAENTTFSFDSETKTLYKLDGSGHPIILVRNFNLSNERFDLTVPSTVTEIGTRAFQDIAAIRNVTLPAATVTISGYAFANSGVTVINLDKVTVIGECSFKNSKITEANLASLTKASSYSFESCTELVRVNIGGDIVLSYSMFKNCTSLATINITGVVREVNTYALENTAVTSLVFPEGLTSIGSNAISSKDLATLSLPVSLTSFNSYGVMEHHLVSISVAEGNTSFKVVNGALFDFSGKFLYLYPSGSTATSFQVPDGVTTIYSNAFYNSDSLKYITFEDASDLKSLDTYSFRKCGNGIALDLSGTSITNIPSYAFYGAGIVSVSLPSTLTSIQSSAFQESAIRSFTLPNTVTYFGADVFSGCEDLASFTFDEGCKITAIPTRTFSGCTSLTSLEIPSCITSINSEAFGSSGLRSITVPATVTSVSSYAFYKCADLVTVDWRSSADIPYYGFNGCYNLKSVTLSSGVTNIGGSAFYNCITLGEVINKSSLVLRAGYGEYGYVAYYADRVVNDSDGTSQIESYTVDGVLFAFRHDGDSYTLVGYLGPATGVFTLPETVAGITNYSVNASSFVLCSEITAFALAGSNTSLSVVDGVLYNADGTALLAYPAAKVADTVTASKTENKTGLTEYTCFEIGKNVNKVGDFALFGSRLQVIFVNGDSAKTCGKACFAVSGMGESMYLYIEMNHSGDYQINTTGVGSVSYTSLMRNSLYYCYEFQDAKGNVVESYYKGISRTMTKVDVPAVSGYDGSWSPAVPAYSVFGGQVYKATYVPTPYEIAYVDSLEATNTNPVEYNIETATFKLADLSCPGYTFDGWFSNDSFAGDRVTQVAIGTTGSLKFYAKWSVNEYTITFDSNGGSAVAPITQDYKSEVKAPAAPTKTGYTFDRWDPAVPATMPVDGVKLTAQWVANTYYVVFNGNGSTSGSMEKQAFTYDAVAKALTSNTFVKIGYTFAGWNSAADGSGTPYTDAQAVVNLTAEGDYTLYAQWTPNTYTVAFDGNSPTSGSMEVENFTYGTGKALSVNQFQKTEKIFLGWSTAADGEVEYADGQIVTDLVSTDGGSITLYAVWGDRNLAVTIYKDGIGYTGLTVKVEIGGNDLELVEKSAGLYYIGSGLQEGKSHYLYINGEFIHGVYVSGATNHTVNYYTVSFANTGSSVIESQVIIEGQNAVEPAAPTRDGCTFAGWKVGEDAYVFEVKVMETTTVTAAWDLVPYTIKYNLDGGINGTNPEGFNVESEAIVFASATKTGYDFGGWYSDKALSVPVTGVPAGSVGNVEVYAKFTITDYTITYHLDGGANSAKNPASYTVETDAITLSDPTKTGYDFGGWFVDKEFKNAFTGTEKGSTGNIDVYAKFTLTVYKLTYVMNGGSNAAGNPATYTIVDKVVFGDAYKDWNYFEGWFIDGVKVTSIEQGTIGDKVVEARFDPIMYKYTVYCVSVNGVTVWGQTEDSAAYGESVTPKLPSEHEGYITPTQTKTIIISDEIEKNVVTYVFDCVEYSITYQLNGGTAVNAGTYTIDDKVVFSDASKAGYDFAGWYIGDDKVTGIDKKSTGDKTVIAKFTPKTITVSFNANGGTGSMDAAEYTFSEAGYVLPENGFTAPADKMFIGWLADNDGDVLVGNAVIYDDVTLYAVWGDATISIAFNANGGEGTMSAISDYDRKAAHPIVNAFTREHYTFIGWNTSADGQGVGYPADADAKNVAATCTLYAQWKINQYTITFNTDGGNEIAAITQDYGTVVTAPAAPTKTGYTFVKWDAEVPATIPAGDVTLNAVWKINQYTITFNTDGGNEIAAITQDYGTVVTAPAAPVRAGYSFAAWNDAIPATIPAKDVTITALWEVATYTISYELNGGSVSGTNPVSYTMFDAEDVVLIPAAKEGYIFVGWYTDGMKAVESIKAGSAGDVALYAIFAVAPAVEDKKAEFTAEDGKDYVSIVIDDALAGQLDSVDVKFNNGGSISFPVSVLTQAGTVTMKGVDKESLPADVQAKIGDGVVFSISTSITNDFGDDKVTVTLPYTQPAGKDYQIVKVYWLKEDGTLEEFDAVYTAGFVTFQTTHFSDWVVKSVDPETMDITVDGTVKSLAFGSVFKNVVSAPSKDGYTFAGWYSDSACTVAFDDNTVIDHAGITVYSKFTENVAPEPENNGGGSKGGMCGSTIAAIVVSMCAVLAIPVIRYVRP